MRGEKNSHVWQNFQIPHLFKMLRLFLGTYICIDVDTFHNNKCLREKKEFKIICTEEKIHARGETFKVPNSKFSDILPLYVHIDKCTYG